MADSGEKTNPLLIESFTRDINKAVEILDGLPGSPGLEGDDLREFTITVHGIKSSLGNLHEKELAETANRLEDAGRNGDVDLIAADAPGFLAALRELQAKLRQMPGGGGSGDPGGDCGDDPTDIREKILELKEMCADYNRKGALEIISGIEVCSAKTRAVLESIKEHVLHSDYEEAESAAELYADEL